MAPRPISLSHTLCISNGSCRYRGLNKILTSFVDNGRCGLSLSLTVIMGNGASASLRSEDTSIIIIGAGYGGTALAKTLVSTGRMKIINPYDFMFHSIGALRATVEPDFTGKIMIPLAPTFGESFVKGRVVEINKETNSVTLDNGTELKYSHLVLATGSTSTFPAKLSNDHPQASDAETKRLYQDINSQIQQADTIVCVGGGPVGVELSGELKTDYPKKTIILIHSNDKLASSRMSNKVQKALHKTLSRKGIQLMLGERVSNLQDIELNKFSKDQTVRTESGKEIMCDMVIRCTGGRPNTAQYKNALGSSITDKGLIKVNEFLQVEGSENIFAMGDIVDIDEEKMAVAASAHALIIKRNISAIVNGEKMHAYKPGKFLMLVPVGRDGGVGELPFMTVGDTFTRVVKAGELFTNKTWSSMGQKPPK